MKINEIINHRDMNQYVEQIPSLIWTHISKSIWETIQDEGIDVEQSAPSPSMWEMANLTITSADKENLKKFDADTVDDFNVFDIKLKEQFPGYVDLIDYENGMVTIVRTI